MKQAIKHICVAVIFVFLCFLGFIRLLAGKPFALRQPQKPAEDKEKSTAPLYCAYDDPHNLTDPEGLPVTVLSNGEIGTMGGATVCTCKFADGTVLEGLGSCWAFSDDGRYFAAPVPKRSDNWHLILLDRWEHTIYRLFYDADRAVTEVDAIRDGKIIGRDRDGEKATVDLQAAIQSVRPIALMRFTDIWVVPEKKFETLENSTIQWPSPKGQSLTGKVFIPESLSASPIPLHHLHYPNYRVFINGEETGIVAPGVYFHYAWRDNGQAFICKPAGGDRQAEFMLWEKDQGWRSLPSPNLSRLFTEKNMPHETSEAIVSLESDVAWIAYLSGATYCTQHSPLAERYTFKPSGINISGKNAQYTISTPQYVVGLKLSDHSLYLRSETLQNGIYAEFTPVSGRPGVFSCSIGTHHLPGLWCDHKVAYGGRYLALRAADSADTKRYGVDRFFIYDSTHDSLMPCPTLPYVAFAFFSETTLGLIVETAPSLPDTPPHASNAVSTHMYCLLELIEGAIQKPKLVPPKQVY